MNPFTTGAGAVLLLRLVNITSRRCSRVDDERPLRGRFEEEEET